MNRFHAISLQKAPLLLMGWPFLGRDQVLRLTLYYPENVFRLFYPKQPKNTMNRNDIKPILFNKERSERKSYTKESLKGAFLRVEEAGRIFR